MPIFEGDNIARRQAVVEAADVETLSGRTVVCTGVKLATGVNPGGEYLRNRLFDLLKRSEISYDLKDRMFKRLTETETKNIKRIIRDYDVSEKLKDAILELYS